MKCQNCGQAILSQDTYCGHCGALIDRSSTETSIHKCVSCGFEADYEFSFCPECGYANSLNEDQPSPGDHTRVDNQSATSTKDLKPNKKKGGFFRALGRFMLGLFFLLIAAAALLYYLGDEDQTSKMSDFIGSSEEVTFVDQPEQGIIKTRRTLVKGTIDPENRTLESREYDVSMTFDPLCFDGAVEGDIQQVDVENPPENTILNAYQFNLNSSEDLGGIVTLMIPYDASKIPSGRSVSDCVSGVVYHEELREWIEETSTVDEDRNVVLISTTHLSPHASKISLTKEQQDFSEFMLVRTLKGRPDERAVPLNIEYLVNRLSQEDMEKILGILSTFGAGNPKEILSDASLKFVGDGGSFVGMGNEFLQLAPYSEHLSKTLTKRLSQFGAALVIIQFASDVYFDKPPGVIAFNTAKGVFFLKAAGTAAAAGGPVVGGVATIMVTGMFLLDVTGIAPISPPLYRDEVHHRVAVRAYELYYEENGKTEKQWMELTQFFIKDVAEEGLTGEAYNKRYTKLLKQSVTDYTEEFFGENEKVITEYMTRAFDEVQGYIGGYDRVYSESNRERNQAYVKEYVSEIIKGEYNGETTSLVDELQKQYADELIKKTIPDIMKRKSEQQYKRQEELLRVSQMELIQMLNSKFYIHFVDRNVETGQKSKYEEYIVAPIVVDKSVLKEHRPEKWMLRLNSVGEGRLDMTLLAHYRTKYFTEFGLYNKGDYEAIINGTAKPVKKLKLGKLSGKTHYINISGDDAKINIIGERYTDIDIPEGNPLEYSFSAESDYAKKCYIVWDFGENQQVKKQGNKSKVKHTFQKPGEYQISATLYDENDTKLARDKVSINWNVVPEVLEETSRDLAFYQLYFKDKPTEMVYSFAKGYVVIGRWTQVKKYYEDGSIYGGELALGKYTYDSDEEVYFGDLGTNGRFTARVRGNKIEIYNENGEFFREGVLLTGDRPFVTKKKIKKEESEEYNWSDIYPEPDED